MRLAYVWGVACLVIGGCSVRDRTGLKIADATKRDAGPQSVCAAADCDADSGSEEPPPARTVDCHDGDCWWTRQQESCRSAGAPGPADRPAQESSKDQSIGDIYLGFTRMRLGETGPDGTPDRTAWQRFGFDLDGMCTNAPDCSSKQRSCRPASMQTPFDGEHCRDNTFASLMPVAAAIPEIGARFGLSEELFNCNLHRGSYNVVLKLSGYNGESNDAHVRVDLYLSPGRLTPPDWTCPNPSFEQHYPRWRSSSEWMIDPENLTEPIKEPGKLPASKVADPDAYVRDGYLVVTFPDGTVVRLAGNKDVFRGFALVGSQNVWAGRLERDPSDSWNLRDGILAGRTGREDLLRSFRQIGLCNGVGLDGFYRGTADWIDQSVDVRLDGSVDPDSPCDAISFGLGFEAAQLIPGPAEPIIPLVECCEPGMSFEDCSPECGDGRKNGKETCDTAIAVGKAGACPSMCPGGVACMKFELLGEKCSKECKPTPITVIGVADGCCPMGADATADRDCPSICGNNVIEPGETCDPQANCPVCAVADQCLTVSTTGTADGCDISCSISPVNACITGDGCCPEACSASNDSDCSTTCDNGTVEAKETCDGDGERACPATCDDNQACTTDYRSGSASQCSVVCTHVPVTAAISGDGCCPVGASANTDTDCAAECGNGRVEFGEDCDDGNTESGDGCAASCTAETSVEACIALISADRRPECTRCNCERCANEALNCYGVTPEDTQLCGAVVRCGLENSCSGEVCYCGSEPVTTCIFGRANGPCKAKVEAAARSTVPGDVVARADNVTYPLGRANALASCAKANCTSECEIQ